MLCPLIELLEIIRGVVKVLAPIEAEPAHVALDGVDIFLLFLGRVGVVEAEMTAAAELLGDAEIEADRLGMADMKVAVGLGRKARDHGRATLGVEIGLDDVADKVAPGFFYRCFAFCHSRPAGFACIYLANPCRSAKCSSFERGIGRAGM